MNGHKRQVIHILEVFADGYYRDIAFYYPASDRGQISPIGSSISFSSRPALYITLGDE